jgi:UDP-3-O-[3-hydroxymyristoyl] glucosamine N-acyltransferase
MADPRFYDNAGPFSLAQVVELTGGKTAAGADAQIADVAALDTAGPGQLSYCDGPKFKSALEKTQAGVVLVSAALAASVPKHALAVLCDRPALAFAKVATALYPNPLGLWPPGKPPIHAIAPSARIGEGSVLAPGVFIGEDVEIGDDCVIGPGVVIGRGVRIGHRAWLGAHVKLSHALIGDRCIVHGGTAIGQDGFGYVPGAAGHFKIPQLGRVIIQDDVEIGANTCIDRGALGDTVIGEGTKIDNMVQIGHNNRIGRRSLIAAQVGFAGSSEVGDFVVFGGQVGIADHLKIGSGAFIAAKAGVTRSLDGGKVHGGFPAKPIEQWRREVASLSRLAKGKRNKDERDGG